MIGRLVNWWRARQRRIDVQILWPICKQRAADLNQAKSMFAMHCCIDSAWEPLGEQGIIDAIEELK